MNRTVTIPQRSKSRNTYGGYLFPSSFTTSKSGTDSNHRSPIAESIMSDVAFDLTCRRNIEKRKWFMEHKDEYEERKAAEAENKEETVNGSK